MAKISTKSPCQRVGRGFFLWILVEKQPVLLSDDSLPTDEPVRRIAESTGKSWIAAGNLLGHVCSSIVTAVSSTDELSEAEALEGSLQSRFHIKEAVDDFQLAVKYLGNTISAVPFHCSLAPGILQAVGVS